MEYPIEFERYVSPDGLIYRFNDDIDRFVWGFQGEGMSPIEYLTQRGPFQHGDSVLDYRLRPRIVTLIHRRNMCDREDYWEKRAEILNYLRPNRQAIGSFNTGILRKQLPNGDIRDLNVLITEGLNFDSVDDHWDQFSFEQAIRFTAWDPLYYGATNHTLTFVPESNDDLVFPITFPIEFGSGFIDEVFNITYEGTFASFPAIVITGPASGPTFYNTTTGESLGLNYDIPAGVIVTINLQEGRKTVEDNLGNNLIGTVSLTDGDIATFHLEPDPGAPGGVNAMRLTVAGTIPGQTSVAFTYQDRYIGV